jgi:hypothetical protein
VGGSPSTCGTTPTGANEGNCGGASSSPNLKCEQPEGCNDTNCSI